MTRVGVDAMGGNSIQLDLGNLPRLANPEVVVRYENITLNIKNEM